VNPYDFNAVIRPATDADEVAPVCAIDNVVAKGGSPREAFFNGK